MKESGFSNTQLDKIMKSRPQLLSASLENSIKPKIKIFQDLGFTATEIAKIISKEPTILCCSANDRVIPSLRLLKGLLGSDEDLVKVLGKSGWFLTRDLEKTLVPNVEFLKSYGVPSKHILHLFYRSPRSLMHKPEIMRKYVDKVEKMGIQVNSKMFIHAVGTVASLSDESWELKLLNFRNLGFTEEDISIMLRRAPQVFAASSEKIKRVKEILLATGKYDMSCIVKYPMSLGSSIENRYIPRFRVLGILEDMNVIETWPPFPVVHRMPAEKFFKLYVEPHLNEVGQAYIIHRNAGNKRS